MDLGAILAQCEYHDTTRENDDESVKPRGTRDRTHNTSTVSSLHAKEFPREVDSGPVAMTIPTSPDVSPTQHVLVWDTETSDFGGYVIQLAYTRSTGDGVLADEATHTLRLPDGQTISKMATRVHGITPEWLDKNGEEALPVLRRFGHLVRRTLRAGGRVVCHNAKFDVARFNATIAAHADSPDDDTALKIDPALVFCTMRASHPHVLVRNRRGALKMPRNDELYTHLTGTAPDLALHDALNDARITTHSFFSAVARGWWPPLPRAR